MNLKYLPIPIVRVLDSPSKFTRQFTSEISVSKLIESPSSAFKYYVRKIQLLLQREYRKVIFASKLPMDSFHLKLYTDITFVEQGSNLFIYCLVELCKNE